MATIATIDRHRGLVELDSELGILQAHAPPAELEGLQVGDKLLVQMAEGEPPTRAAPLRLNARRPLLPFGISLAVSPLISNV